jgi:glycosyltransferase involved in cell wall biosynthesis
MHIAFWSPGWPLERCQNGIVTYVHWMKRGLEEAGHQVSVFTSFVSPDDLGPGIHRVQPRMWQKLVNRIRPVKRNWEQTVFSMGDAIAAEILRVHRSTPIDCIDMEESFGWHETVQRKTSIPVFVKLHGPAFLSMIESECKTPFGRKKIKQEGEALRTAALIASPSITTLQATLDYYGLTPPESAHIVNPLGMSPSTPVWDYAACDPKTILFVGRFDLRKGGDLVLRAFRTLLDADPSLKLVFVGPDTGLMSGDGTTLSIAEYVDMLFPPGMKPAVQYLGRLPNHEIPTIRVRAMVTVVASRWENIGYTLLEAMYQGCPVVSTDVGGCGECIINGTTGLLAQTENADDLAAKIREFLDSPGFAIQSGRNARAFIASAYADEKVLGETISAYRKLLRS